MAGHTEASARDGAQNGARRVTHPPCALCRDEVDWVDYKNVPLLRRYVSDRGRIHARRVTGNCARHQNEVAMAIKTARELVLLPRPARGAPKTFETASAGEGGR
jgi:ribosomal protein S18